MRGTLHTGVDAGTSLGPGRLLISKNGEYLDIPVTKNGNDYVWEVPNVKSGDEIQIWQEVYFRSLKKPRDQPTVTFKGTVHPQQYPPPDAIKVTPENKNQIYNGDPRPDSTHGGHGWNATNPKRNKDLFPESWTEDDIARAAIAIAKNPKPYPRRLQDLLVDRIERWNMDEAYYAEQDRIYEWWSERIDKLLDGLRARIEASAAQRGYDESPYVFYDAMRGQAEFTILIDAVAATLSRAKIPITPAERDLFRELMYKIEDPDPMFRFLHDRDHVMTELNVVDELPPLSDPVQEGHPALEVSIDLHRQGEQ